MKACAPTSRNCAPITSGHLPVIPAEHERASNDVAEAGAVVIRLRAFDTDARTPDLRPEMFLPFGRPSTDALIKTWPGRRQGKTIEERLGAAATDSAEMARLCMGAERFGISSLLEEFGEWKFNRKSEFLAKAWDVFPALSQPSNMP